jgi:recombination protein RecA
MPKLLAHWIRKNAQTISKQKVIILVITHHITNTSGYGKHKLPDGGLYLQYQADTMIEFKSAEPWDEGTERIGQVAECNILCSSLGSAGKKCQTFIRYGLGIDKAQESIALATELGLIDKSGTWMYLDYLEGEVEGYDRSVFKAQGAAKLYEMITSTPEYLEILLRKIKEML